MMPMSALGALVRSQIWPEWAKDVNASTLRADLLAGFTSATVVLPQAVAFAAIAGLPPQYGLYTAIVIPVVAALVGSSKVMVSGPTLVISALVFSTLYAVAQPGSPDFIAKAIVLTLLVGIFQFAFGALRLGNLVNFVSHSVMTGFTAAAAILISVTQFKDALGVTVPRGASIVDNLGNLLGEAEKANVTALLIAGVTLVTLVALRAFAPKLPAFILALLAGSGLAFALDAEGQGVAMIGAVPSVVPAFALPDASIGMLSALAQGAFAIALLGLIEALSIARAFAQKTHQRFSPNREIVAQGLSNVVGSFFQCYAGSGSFTRSGVNYESGARTPISAIASSVFLVGILLVVAPLFARIPVPAIAAVILYVAFRLIDIVTVRHIIATSHTETLIVAATLLAGLFVNLEFSIYVGVITSLFIFLSRTAKPALAIGAPDARLPNRPFRNAEMNTLPECPQAVFARLDGPLYFGSVDNLDQDFDHITRTRPLQKRLVLILRGVGDIDLPGAELLIEETRRRRAAGGHLILVARYPPLRQKLFRFGVIRSIGESNLFESKSAAIEALVPLLDLSICRTCHTRIFIECPPLPTGAKAAPPTSETDALTTSCLSHGDGNARSAPD